MPGPMGNRKAEDKVERVEPKRRASRPKELLRRISLLCVWLGVGREGPGKEVMSWWGSSKDPWDLIGTKARGRGTATDKRSPTLLVPSGQHTPSKPKRWRRQSIWDGNKRRRL